MESKDVQSVLVQENERDVLGNTMHVSELFKKCLKSAGPTYIFLDGLDEMEAFERGLLLQQVTDLEGCSEAKVLISSRPEADISNALENRATAIRVEKRNSESIRTYVDQRARDWMKNGDFDQEAQEQIRALLAPVAATANGNYRNRTHSRPVCC